MRDRIYDALTRYPRYLGGLAVLVVALLVTQGLQAWQIHRVAADVPARQAHVARTAQSTIQQDFDHLVAELERLAQRTARQTDVNEGMRAHEGDDRSEPLIRHAARRHLPENFAIEFYDREERLLAWNGFSMPLDDALHAPDTLDTSFTTVARDDGVRWALVAWQPVRHNGEVVGAVRAMRLVHFRMPVQNQYIQDYSLERRWRIQTGYPVTVVWGAVDAVADLEDREGVLRAGDHVLGRVVVQPPDEEQLLQSVQQRYADLSALWQTLLLFWLVAGLWMWYRRVDRTASGSDSVRRQAAVRFLVVAVAWWGLRYMLIEMDVPGRWQMGKAPLAPLFDPTHLASPIGGGIMESIGDLLVTACFALLFTVGFIDLAARFRVHSRSLSTFWMRVRDIPAVRPSVWRFLGVVVVAVLVELGQVLGLARLARRAVLDSTLDFFARTGLLPEPLVLAVLCSLLLITVAAVLCGAGVIWIALHALGRYRPREWGLQQLVSAVALTAGGVFVAVFVATGNLHSISVPIAIAHGGVVLGVALVGIVQGGGVVKHFTLRSLLPGLIVLTVLLYPMLYDGMDRQRRGRMVDATTSFVEGSDPRVMFSLEQVLRRARESVTVQRTFDTDRDAQLAALDSVATELLRTSLVASLSQYEANLLLIDAVGTPQESYSTTGSEAQRGGGQYEPSVFNALRVQAAMRGDGGPVVERLTDRRQQSRFRYAGLVAISDTSRGTVGWVMARAEPRSLLPGAGTPYPRVLLPEGLYGDLYADLALAEFREGTIVRSIGDFGRARLTSEARDALQERAALWRTESVNGRRYLAYYRQEYGAPHAVVAARMPAIMVFDHLYYLLRLVIAGFGIGVPFYLLGLYLRYRRGVLPAPRVRFRDKMLDAFLVVGSIAVVVVGFVGARTIVSENERAVHNQLQQNINRVEEALLLDTQRDEMLYRAVERTRIDSLANRVGLDLNLYADGRLVASSRPRLVREQLIDARMPVAAYEALYHDAYHFTTTTEQFGAFTYTVGYQAIPDETGQPRYVLAVPTLPEQERIQEERARTLAYLLGALLLLIIVIMVTALFLANALAQPIARLREGLEAVGEGRYAKRLPIDTRDEIGELVQTFNAMREQLAESRRRLAQQERELAWREMARQVAHEIKNPLTPMKLAVQHLRRAFQQVDGLKETEQTSGGEGLQRFTELFDRITSTLVEQINTLARIANEFSTFARLPERVPEPLDLNEVIREAVALMREEEEDVAIELDLHSEPLVVKADREELRRLYINLIKNAIQAIPASRDGHITVATSPDGAAQQVQSWVQDNGVGIPPAQRDKIFQPNFSTKTSGTGLGLAIARKTIGELSGDIGFHTKEGTGTTFWVRLPRAA